jgi:hypothetical protein
VSLLEKAIEQRAFPSTKAELLRLRGHLAIHKISETGIEAEFDEPIKWWMRLTDLLPDAPLFPLENFADTLTAICHVLSDRPNYSELTAKVDEALSKRVGGFIAAEKSRDRAMVHYKHGRMRDAISEIHTAKINWFTEETAEGFFLAAMVLAKFYQEIGLQYAAKYHALFAAQFALSQQRAQIQHRAWTAILEAAHCDYAVGAWAGFIELAHLSLFFHGKLAKSPFDSDMHQELDGLYYHACMVVVLTKKLSPKIGQHLYDQIAKWNLGGSFDGLIRKAEKEFEDMDADAVVTSCKKQLDGFPASDLGFKRSYTWGAQEITWKVSWLNTYESTTLAEQFIACFQILQAETTKVDLCLPKTFSHC